MTTIVALDLVTTELAHSPPEFAKKEILPCRSRRDMKSLDDAVIERQEAVVEKAAERDLMVGEVLECLAEVRRRWLVLLAHTTPAGEFVDDRLVSLTPLDELSSGSSSRNSSSILYSFRYAAIAGACCVRTR